MNNRIKKHLNKLIKVVKLDKDVLAVLLFGSVARGESDRTSDIDICLVLMPGKYINKELSQKRLEYTKLFNLDIQIFQQLPIYIRIRVLKDSQVLFCRNIANLYSQAFRAIEQFADFEHIYRDYLKEVANVG